MNDTDSSNGGSASGVVRCTECEHGTIRVRDAIYANCDNCDAVFERNEVGI